MCAVNETQWNWQMMWMWFVIQQNLFYLIWGHNIYHKLSLWLLIMDSMLWNCVTVHRFFWHVDKIKINFKCDTILLINNIGKLHHQFSREFSTATERTLRHLYKTYRVPHLNHKSMPTTLLCLVRSCKLLLWFLMQLCSYCWSRHWQIWK